MRSAKTTLEGRRSGVRSIRNSAGKLGWIGHCNRPRNCRRILGFALLTGREKECLIYVEKTASLESYEYVDLSKAIDKLHPEPDASFEILATSRIWCRSRRRLLTVFELMIWHGIPFANMRDAFGTKSSDLMSILARCPSATVVVTILATLIHCVPFKTEEERQLDWAQDNLIASLVRGIGAQTQASTAPDPTVAVLSVDNVASHNTAASTQEMRGDVPTPLVPAHSMKPATKDAWSRLEQQFVKYEG